MKGTVIIYDGTNGKIKIGDELWDFRYHKKDINIGDVVDVQYNIYPKKYGLSGIGVKLHHLNNKIYEPKNEYRVGVIKFAHKNGDHGYIREIKKFSPRVVVSIDSLFYKYDSEKVSPVIDTVSCYIYKVSDAKAQAKNVDTHIRNAIYIGGQDHNSLFLIGHTRQYITVESKDDWAITYFAELDLQLTREQGKDLLQLVAIQDCEAIYEDEKEKLLSILYLQLHDALHSQVLDQILRSLSSTLELTMVVAYIQYLYDQDSSILKEHAQEIIQTMYEAWYELSIIIMGLLADDLNYTVLLQQLIRLYPLNKEKLYNIAKEMMLLSPPMVEELIPTLRTLSQALELYEAKFKIDLGADEIHELFEMNLHKSTIDDGQMLFIDIEANEQVLKEFGYAYEGETEVIKRSDYPSKELFNDEIKAVLSKAQLLIGHNIKEYDIPKLEHFLDMDLSSILCYDTLEWELALDQKRPSYALETSHNALDDVIKTKQLFINQMYRLIISGHTSMWIPHLPAGISKGIDCMIKDKAIFVTQEESIINESHQFYKKPIASPYKESLYEGIQQRIEEERKNILVIDKDLWKDLVSNRSYVFTFGEPYPTLLALDRRKILDQLRTGSYVQTVLLSILDQANSPIYWHSLAAYIQQYLKRTKGIQDEDILSIHQGIGRSESIEVVSFEQYIRETQAAETNIILCTNSGVEQLSKIQLATFDHTALSKEWDNKKLWIHFAQNKSSVKLDENTGTQIISTYDPKQQYQYHWIEHQGSKQEYILWGAYSLDKIRDIKAYSEIKYFDLKQLESSYKFQYKSVVKFKIDANIDPENRVIALNPETHHRSVYWTINEIIIQSKADGNPLLLATVQENEIPLINGAFRALGYYIPAEGTGLRRKVELLKAHQKKEKILVVALKNLQETIEYTDKSRVTVFFDGFPLNDQLIWKQASIINEDKEEDVSITEKGAVELEGDVYYQMDAYYNQYRYMEQLMARSNPNIHAYLLDQRFHDFASIRKRYGLNVELISEITDLNYYEGQVAIVQNYFHYDHDEKDLDIDQAIHQIQDVFIKGKPLRDDQKAFIRQILPGEKNIVVTLPTGGGKSILFEGPALYKGSLYGRLTLIISPLKALMKDHFEKLIRLGFFTSIDYINHDKGLEVQDIYRRVAGGELLFLYITPERFKSKGFISALNQRLRVDKRLEYVVFDEAHCISQWGNEFRPDYYRASQFIKELQHQKGDSFPTLLFSATVTDQVYHDLEKSFHPLMRIEEYAHTNPIRDHIKMEFVSLEHQKSPNFKRVNQNFIDYLLKDLKKRFNASKSKVIVFVLSRIGTEEYCNALNNEPQHPYKGGYYHAGLDAEERETTYNAYQEGEIQILFATKAFGMGMDIKNIHYVYHFGPSSNFEDFLQEVGRAGRDQEKLSAAGFVDGNVIRTRCLITDQDFAYLRESSHKNQISWDNIKQVEVELDNYMAQHEVIAANLTEPLAVPQDILTSSDYFKGEKNLAQLYTVAGYWLEKTKKYKQRYFVTGVFSFSSKFANPEIAETKDQKSLLDLLARQGQDKSIIDLSIAEISQHIEKKSSGQVFSLIYNMHVKKLLDLQRQIHFSPFKTIFREEMRLFNANHNVNILYVMHGIASIIKTLSLEVELNNRKVYHQNDIEKIVEKSFKKHFDISAFNALWQHQDAKTEIAKKEVHIKKYQLNFKKRAHAVFYIINQIPGLKAEYKISAKSKEVHTIIYRNASDRAIIFFLDSWLMDMEKFIKSAIHLMLRGDGSQDLISFIQHLKLDSNSLFRLNFLFTCAKRFGYFKNDNSVIPVAMETFKLSDKPIDEKNDEQDALLYDEFNKSINLKKLRLLVLESLQRIPSKEHGSFIEAYFKCGAEIDIVNLISEYDSQADLKQFRATALKESYESLNADQKAIFDSPLKTNLNVIAGPGTGKTHTLISRVAKLIQEDMISPDQILLLAYNRSVVEELRTRISDLFAQLGYRNIVKSLKIHTFASLEKYALRNRLQEALTETPVFIKGVLDIFRSREAFFLHLLDTEPGYIRNSIGSPRFLFVDEFQDITSDRIKILKGVYTENYTSITVIGDPVQSIYGFERSGDIGPQAYYDEFNKVFLPKKLNLSINYRSYQEITDYSQKLLKFQIEKFELPTLSTNKGSGTEVYTIDLLDKPTNFVPWKDVVLEFLSAPARQEMAILFRTNGDLFRTYAKLKDLGIKNSMIHIQSSNLQFTRTREVSYLLDSWDREQTISDPTLDVEIDKIKTLIIEKPQWEASLFYKLISLILEYKNIQRYESTFEDLHEYIEDISRKDDGVLWKLYKRHFSHQDTKRLVLSTIHKSKGLEFDEVLVLPSISSLKMQPLINFKDICQEEERLLYVAFTRAKNRLYHYKWKREHAIFNLIEFENVNPGYYIKPEMNNVFINSFGYAHIQQYLHKQIRIGDGIVFRSIGNSRVMTIGTQSMGKLKGVIKDRMNAKFGTHDVSSYYITGTFKYYYKEMVEANIAAGATFHETLDPYSKNQGYVLLPLFAGFGSKII